MKVTQGEILKLKGLMSHEGWTVLKKKLEEKLYEEIMGIESSPLSTLRDYDVWRGGRLMLRRVMKTPEDIILGAQQGEEILVDPEEISVL